MTGPTLLLAATCIHAALGLDADPAKLARPVYTVVDVLERNIVAEWDENQWITQVRLDQWVFWARPPAWRVRSCGWYPWKDATLTYRNGWWYLDARDGSFHVAAPVLVVTVTAHDRELADRETPGLPRLIGQGCDHTRMIDVSTHPTHAREPYQWEPTHSDQ